MKMKPMTVILLAVVPEAKANRGTSELIGRLMEEEFDWLKQEIPGTNLQACMVRYDSPFPGRVVNEHGSARAADDSDLWGGDDDPVIPDTRP